MKFNDGAWRTAIGVSPAFPRRVFEHRVDSDAMHIRAVDKSGNQGIDRVEGTVLGIEVSSPMPDVIRVRVHHHQPPTAGQTQFELDYGLKAKGVKVEDAKDHLRLTSGRLSLRIAKMGIGLQFEADGEPLCGSDGNGLGYMTYAGPPNRPAPNGQIVRGDVSGAYLMQRLSLAVGECIYGMGERFGPLVKNGQTVTIWNEDGGTMSELAYKNVPFYLSSRGYGLLVNNPGRVEFEVASERVSSVQFCVPGEVLDYYVFYGPDPKDVIAKYTRLSGRAAVPPAWSFGLWLSTSFTTSYDEKTVNSFIDGMAERGIPLSVFHFDCFWMKERQWCDFEWDKDAFPDPEGMLKRLKMKGLKVCVWINSYISQFSPLFDEGAKKGYLIKRPDGTTYQRDAWQPGMGLVDFTNPAAVKWYQSKLRRLLEMGVDCFKTDFAELIPTDVVFHDGSDPQLMHNLYSYLYNKAVFELLEDFHGKGGALVFARSGTAGSQKFPLHWGGDCFATFEAMAEDLRGGLSFCLSGPAFWSHDIGGFEGTANPACYKRWVAFGLMSTHSRLHGSGSYRVPWVFDDEAVDVMRHFVKLKNRLFPYLFGAAHDANELGHPAMRAMVLEFADDPACRHLDRQYLLGGSLLVAPIFNEQGDAEYYLPPGRWTDLQTQDTADGGSWRKHRCDFFQIPLWVRQNTLLPMSRNDASPGWKSTEPLDLHVYELADGGVATVRVVPTDAKKPTTFQASRKGDTITLQSTGHAGEIRVIVHDSDLDAPAEAVWKKGSAKVAVKV